MDIGTPTNDAPAPLSTRIDTAEGSPASGAGAPRTLPSDAAPESLRDTITAVMKEEAAQRAGADEPKADKGEVKADGAEGKTDDAKVEAKQEPKAPKADEPKAAKAAEPKEQAAAEKPEGAEQPSERDGKPADPDAKAKADGKAAPGPRIYNAPEKFGPDAKEVWRNVPHAVRRDIDIMQRQHAEEIERHREAAERYETIRQYDELARQNGRDLAYSLERVKLIEDTMQANPLAALELVLQEAGPRKANGQPLSLYEVAQYIVEQGPDQYRAQVRQGLPQPPHPAEIQAQQAQEEARRLQARILEMEVIAPFRKSHPRYSELEGSIAQILESAMIPTNLSPAERLELAYAYAERLNPPSVAPAKSETGPAPDNARAVPDDFGGSKSIKSSAGAVSDDMGVDTSSLSRRDILRDELRRRARA